MSIHLITGQGTTDHITSADTGSLNAGIVGTGRYVLNRGNKFAYEIVSNNLIKIKDGDLLNQGRHINIAVNDYEECAIENGLQSVKRNDLIVLRYTKNAETEIEIASVVVIKGVSGDTAVNPSYIYGDILNGDLVDDFPLYRVKLNGLNIEGVDTLFTTNKTLDEVNTNLTAESTKVGLLADLTTTIKISIVNAINSLVTRLGTTDISTIADGTVTGGISALNTELATTNTNLTALKTDTLLASNLAEGGTITIDISLYRRLHATITFGLSNYLADIWIDCANPIAVSNGFCNGLYASSPDGWATGRLSVTAISGTNVTFSFNTWKGSVFTGTSYVSRLYGVK